MAERIRVIVAEDSVTVRQRIVSVLAHEPGIVVVGEAADGKRAIELCLAERPDVITLDMVMPAVSGLAATEYIMAFCPTPIVIVSGSTNRGEVFRTYDALAAGALDVLEKPRPGEALDVWDRRLVDTVRLASRVRVITHPRARLRGTAVFEPAAPVSARVEPRAASVPVIGIGASTGGPKAIVDTLQELPSDFAAPVVVVTHISEAFSAGFADWLDANTPLPVRIARHGDALEPGVVFVAPAERHLVVEGDRLQLRDDPPCHSCRPSIDVLFHSLARSCRSAGVGVLLTGMGRDGAEGLLAIRGAGGITVAQDEHSSVIYGMPGEAVKLGAALHVLSPSAIGAFLRATVATRVRQT